MQIQRKKSDPPVILALNILMPIVAAVAVVLLIVDVGGFGISPGTRRQLDILNWVVVFIFVAECFTEWGLRHFSLDHLRKNWVNFALISIFLVLLVVIAFSAMSPQTQRLLHNINLSMARLYIVIVRFYILVNLLLRAFSSGRKIAQVNLPSAQIVALSFLLVILVGTGFLLLPRSAATSEKVSFTDALFTATSATCVTGLIVVDTGSYFSQFGQIVILILIQIGGLGLMTTTAFFSLILGRGMSVKESVLMSDALSSKTLSRVSHLIIYILLLTLGFETLGVLSFYFAWSGVERFEHGSVVYYSIFHSISAFCNAGFALFRDSFEGFKGNVAHNMILSLLIIMGGLGFTVIVNLFRFFIFKRERLSLQTKLVLIVTVALIVSGTVLIMLTEWNGTLGNVPLFTKFLTASFQSVTTRTAGFNTISIGHLTNACYFLMMILMFVGASPGSTGGGIKTSTFGIFLGSIWSMLRGRHSVEMFKRKVPQDIVSKALSVIILALMMLALCGFILLYTQEGNPVHIIFELVSAFGTVGLSAGITPDLTILGKIVIITVMFVGRIGPLTLALAIGQRRESVAYEYPDEAVMIG